MAGQKYWKILLVVLVITCENIGLITRGLRPLVINPIFSLVMTKTTRNIFQYFLPAIYYYLNSNKDKCSIKFRFSSEYYFTIFKGDSKSYIFAPGNYLLLFYSNNTLQSLQDINCQHIWNLCFQNQEIRNFKYHFTE